MGVEFKRPGDSSRKTRNASIYVSNLGGGVANSVPMLTSENIGITAITDGATEGYMFQEIHVDRYISSSSSTLRSAV